MSNPPANQGLSEGGRQVPPTFTEDSIAYLEAIASRPPSKNSLGALAGPVAKWFSSQTESEATVAVATAYLKAAAIQLRELASPATTPESEMVRAKQQEDIVSAVGVCASMCRTRRQAISTSGILATLAQLLLNDVSHPPSQLTSVAVEFLQCALLAEHYRYAARIIGNTWPSPTGSVSIKQVLQYYYLRGMIHLGGNDLTMAHRCLWTCLSLPAEKISTIMVEAWKKLVLIQCLMHDGRDDSQLLSLPKCVPNCISRMLSSSRQLDAMKDAVSRKRSTTKQTAPTSGHMAREDRTSRSQSNEMDAEKPSSIACYMDISLDFKQKRKDVLVTTIASYRSILEADGNFGLAEQVVKKFEVNQVQHISRIYATISTAKMASLLGMDPLQGDIAGRVASLLRDSGTLCKIDDDGTITFHDEQEVATLPSMVDLNEWIVLLEKIQRLDVNIVTNTRYQAIVKGGKPGPATGPRGVEDI